MELRVLARVLVARKWAIANHRLLPRILDSSKQILAGVLKMTAPVWQRIDSEHAAVGVVAERPHAAYASEQPVQRLGIHTQEKTGES